MEEATKYLLGQGVLGVLTVYLLWQLHKERGENKSLTDRLEAKADKHAELNRETARQVTEAFEMAMRNAEETRRERLEGRRRRPTVLKPPEKEKEEGEDE